MSKRVSTQAGLPIIHERAAGIDIGSRFHVVALAPTLSEEPVQTFQAFTGDVERMADWLVSLGVKTAEQHPRLARVYQGRTSRNIPPDMARHSENLARIYQQAAEENLALAQQYRRTAHSMKD